MANERCLSCLCWHEPGEHKPKSIPVTLTGQVPAPEVTVFAEEMTEVVSRGCDTRVYPVSGNQEVSDDDA